MQYESTADLRSDSGNFDGLVVGDIFPSFGRSGAAEFGLVAVTATAANSGTEAAASAFDVSDLLKDRINNACRYAIHAFPEIDTRALELARREAIYLAHSEVFAERLFPEVYVDREGEISLCKQTKSGYYDIGVRGAAELSYHVRNDVMPDRTAYGDLDWEDYVIPRELIDSLLALS